MQKQSLTGLILLLAITVSCNLLSVEERGVANYPTVYPAIEFSELQSLNSEYQTLNRNHICSTLNEYGFTGFSEVLFVDGENPCERKNREVVRVEMDNTDTLLTATKKSLLKNRQYTGVEDTSALVLKEMVPLAGCTECGGPNENSVNIEWKLTFEEQLLDSIPISGTEITVVIDAEGVNRIWGNWYKDFYEPDFIVYGYEQVLNGMIGWEIDMRNYTGEEIIYTLQESDLKEEPHYQYLAVEQNGGLEVRKCWAVPVAYSLGDFKGWIAYIDVIEGILLELSTR